MPSDEAVLSILSPAEVVAQIVWRGLEPVFADVDGECMSLTAATVAAQITVHTKVVFLTPLRRILGDWESLRGITEPRGIALQVEGAGNGGRWTYLAPGVAEMGASLLRVDDQTIHGGMEALREELGARGIEARRMPEWRGRRQEYPGAVWVEASVLDVDRLPQFREEIAECALLLARQRSFSFVERRPAGVGGSVSEGLRRAG